MTMIDLATTLVRKSTAATAEVDGQLVALDIDSGSCYGLNKVATRIWDLIAVPTTPESVVAALMADYDVDLAVCQEQTLDLINDLGREGLVDVVSG